MTPTSPESASLPLSSPEGDGCRAMVFAIANHHLALPLHAIVRVVGQPAGGNTLHSPLPYMLYRDRPLSLLNLYPLLDASSSDSADSSVHSPPGSMTIIAQTTEHGLWAIPVDAPPLLLSLSLTQIYPLPASFSPPCHQVADYMTLLNRDTATPTSLLLMNLQKAMRAAGQGLHLGDRPNALDSCWQD